MEQALAPHRDSGTVKSHVLIALVTEAAMKGYYVRYTIATKAGREPEELQATLRKIPDVEAAALPSVVHDVGQALPEGRTARHSVTTPPSDP